MKDVDLKILSEKEKNLFRLILSILETSGLLEAFLRVLKQFIKGKETKPETED